RGNINILSPSGDSVGVKLNGTTGNITASGNIEAAQNVKGATLESTGRATVGEFVQLNGQAEVGKVCQSNGLQGRTAKGKILSCVNGVWTGSVQINNSQCKWFSPANAFSYFGEYSGQLHEKPIICPAGYIMTGSKMWGWAEDVDDEHVDIYCCPLS
ncbi:TPA: shufflon system plasmid conjugative transfer pilus tip adhesin PilV, partial [Salmonella enterica]|nr:shufflon system plasmid conjugative transfer pilus tip adhesin PilV [Salmonella enterica subsp. enterica serovar Typhi]EEA4402742.1 shufflon system plasmid conjugative transfer pilus tip adhesin PilV [Salmonella enterica subsp. enterica serovar Typhi]EEF0019375.1 shufflon system plasmid conjugative transfer pilus tip adhesin PilV [Salmonella enterica subsp. enterica serovar Typhi]HCH9834627.1 shufflon system plasmid conjugative transfer pilus tip adhesin PilV [Salmonella enterica]